MTANNENENEKLIKKITSSYEKAIKKMLKDRAKS